ncbi:MAG: tetratricopeptide repeat protein [Treponema sp.]|jgi:tetratricopeptide (TPR) repeat protein|nr:tetratricopeptide repeat protein [Treponema sp.]
MKIFFLFVSCYCILSGISCAVFRDVASAEEYYTIGMAYFDLGKYAEAEKWLNKAQRADKTMVASEYNLGRIAFETKRYNEAALYFDKILAKDPNNVMALKSAAYTQIKIGELRVAEAFYSRVLALVPESADDGYNYALVLYALEKYDLVETVLSKYRFALLENKDVLLLFARAQRVQHKPEAADSYAQWLEANNDPKVRYEYAAILEEGEFYARALEEYRTILKDLPQGSEDPKKSLLHYTIGRLILIADPENEEGITELETAVTEGFADTEALEALMQENGISDIHKGDIRRIIDRIIAKAKEPSEQDAAKQNDSPEGSADEDPSNKESPPQSDGVLKISP